MTRARSRLLVLVLGPSCLACTPGEDPLDVDTIDALSQARGSASGVTHSGQWQLTLTREVCDCPSVAIDQTSVDLCMLVPAQLTTQVVELDGVLAIDTDFGTLSGAIESDGSFIVASHHDGTTLVGPLELLTRLDGAFSAGNDRAGGWAGQRLLGEVGGDDIDCRWIGEFDASRS